MSRERFIVGDLLVGEVDRTLDDATGACGDGHYCTSEVQCLVSISKLLFLTRHLARHLARHMTHHVTYGLNRNNR